MKLTELLQWIDSVETQPESFPSIVETQTSTHTPVTSIAENSYSLGDSPVAIILACAILVKVLITGIVRLKK